jgi:hypothetical protein
MSEAILSIQKPGPTGKVEQFFRIPVPDVKADTLREAITLWAKKPSDFLIGEKMAKPHWKKAQKLKALRGDEGVIPGIEVAATVEKAFAND